MLQDHNKPNELSWIKSKLVSECPLAGGYQLASLYPEKIFIGCLPFKYMKKLELVTVEKRREILKQVDNLWFLERPCPWNADHTTLYALMD